SSRRYGSSGCRRRCRPRPRGECLRAAPRSAPWSLPSRSLLYDTDGLIDALDQFVLPFIDSLYGRFGYVGVVIAMAIESAAIPVPSELILPFAGWSVSRGVVEPLTGGPWTYWGAVLAGELGNTAGSLVGFAVGACGGRPLLERYGRYVIIRPLDPSTGDLWLTRWGGLTVPFVLVA